MPHCGFTMGTFTELCADFHFATPLFFVSVTVEIVDLFWTGSDCKYPSNEADFSLWNAALTAKSLPEKGNLNFYGDVLYALCRCDVIQLHFESRYYSEQFPEGENLARRRDLDFQRDVRHAL